MAQPFNKISAELRDSTCAALSTAGLTDDHAAWLRKEGNAQTLVEWIDQRMTAEEAAPKKDTDVEKTLVSVACHVYVYVDADGALMEGCIPVVKCPRCRWNHMLITAKLDLKQLFSGMTCDRCRLEFVYRFVKLTRDETEVEDHQRV